MAASHHAGAARSSDTSTDTLPTDPEKQDLTPDTHSGLGHNDNGPMEPNGNAEKEMATPSGETGPPAPAPANLMDPSAYPDGGLQAWLCVLGAFCALFVSFGWINCIGVFQNYYQTHQLSHYSPSTVAWIPSLEACLMFIGGSWVGRLYDNYGPRYLILIGSFLHVFGLMMASISHQYYQFLLSQAVCSSIGASMVFYPAFSATVTWFYQRRAVAVGIVAAGSSLGGVIFPIMVARLVGEVGFAWTMRICAFLILALLIVANLFIKSRIPPFPKPVKLMDFIKPLTEPTFALLTISFFLYYLGLFVPFTFIILEATAKGMGAGVAGYLVSILNAASIFGRTLPAYAADRYIGRFNILLLMSITTTILVLAMWIPARSNAALIVFAALFGFTSGSIVSITPALVAQISDVRQIGVRTGSIFTIVSIAVLISNPIAGALVTADRGGFIKLQVFAGVVMVGGCFFLILARIKLAGPKLTIKV